MSKIKRNLKIAFGLPFLVSITLVLAMSSKTLFYNEFKNAPESISGCNDPIVAAVIYSLSEYPQNWESTEFELIHDSGVEVWIANGDYGLHISASDDSAEKREMSETCRAVLYQTTQSWASAYINKQMKG